MITIADIAREANVSKATVSKALNGYAEISEETRLRIAAIAKEMGYFPNANAKGLITKKSYMVGVLFTESLDVGLEHPLFGGVIEAFKQTMGENGYDTIFITSRIGNEKTSYLNHCKYRNVEGVFVCTFGGEDTLIHELFESDIHCVTTDVDYNENVPIVISDNVSGIEKGYDYLFGMGHRRIAYISGPLNTLSARERLNGYKKALRGNNQPFKAIYVTYCDDYDYHFGVKSCHELLDQCGAAMPTAILAASDMVALGIIEAVQSRGLKVPEDISVIGFDNIEIAKYCTPPLTTIKQSRRKIGVETANTLLSLIRGEEIANRIVIPVELIERQTCCPPRAVEED